MENNERLIITQKRTSEAEILLRNVVHKLSFIKNHGLSDEEIESLKGASSILDKLYNNLEFEIK